MNNLLKLIKILYLFYIILKCKEHILPQCMILCYDTLLLNMFFAFHQGKIVALNETGTGKNYGGQN